LKTRSTPSWAPPSVCEHDANCVEDPSYLNTTLPTRCSLQCSITNRDNVQAEARSLKLSLASTTIPVHVEVLMPLFVQQSDTLQPDAPLLLPGREVLVRTSTVVIVANSISGSATPTNNAVQLIEEVYHCSQSSFCSINIGRTTTCLVFIHLASWRCGGFSPRRRVAQSNRRRYSDGDQVWPILLLSITVP
jgi:hypothetical protein